MPVLTPADAATFSLHGGTFRSFVAPSRGSEQLCAWQLEVPPDAVGTAHRPDREEVLLVQRGAVHVELDGAAHVVPAGGVVVVPAGARLTVGAGPEGAMAWVTTTAGLSATTDDGEVITPPWAR